MLPLLDGRMQLPAEEVQKGRRNGSLHVHVERAIGRMKIYDILKVTNIFIPITIVHHINQIVCVHCMWITALVPPPEAVSESDVEDYFQDMPDDSDDEVHVDNDEDYFASVRMRQRHTIVGLCVILSFCMSVTLFSQRSL